MNPAPTRETMTINPTVWLGKTVASGAERDEDGAVAEDVGVVAFPAGVRHEISAVLWSGEEIVDKDTGAVRLAGVVVVGDKVLDSDG
jgi:hypothetical protein